MEGGRERSLVQGRRRPRLNRPLKVLCQTKVKRSCTPSPSTTPVPSLARQGSNRLSVFYVKS